MLVHNWDGAGAIRVAKTSSSTGVPESLAQTPRLPRQQSRHVPQVSLACGGACPRLGK